MPATTWSPTCEWKRVPIVATWKAGYARARTAATIETIRMALMTAGQPLEGDGETPEMNVLVSVHAEAKQLRRKHDFRPQPTEEREPPVIRSEFVLEMKEKMEREEKPAAMMQTEGSSISANNRIKSP